VLELLLLVVVRCLLVLVLPERLLAAVLVWVVLCLLVLEIVPALLLR
jgi:hypothetical protein